MKDHLHLLNHQLKDYKKALEHCDKAVEFGYDIPEELIAELEPHR